MMTKAIVEARRPRLVGPTWMGDHQGRPGAVNLGPFVSVVLNLTDRLYSLAVIGLTRT